MHAMNAIPTQDDTQLYCKQWGSGPPVVLLSGWPLSSDSWDDQALVLAEAGFRVIAYDRRGFGRSSQPFGGYDYDTLADDLATVIEHHGVQGAMLVGFSMGGGEVARYLSRHAGKGVSKAVLVSSVVPHLLRSDYNPTGVETSQFEAMTLAMKQDRAGFFGGFFKDFFGVGLLSHPVSHELLNWANSQAMMASLKATLACARAFATTDFRPDLPHFRVPTLVIHGTGDLTVPITATGRCAARGIAGAQLIEYEGAPHGLFATHKDRLSADLLAFARA